MILVLVALLLQTAALSKEARGSFWELSVRGGKGDQNKQYVYIEDRGADIKVTDLATSTETLAPRHSRRRRLQGKSTLLLSRLAVFRLF
jgi:hypothetical protein